MKLAARTATEDMDAAGKKRLQEAKADFQKMQETLAPFVKKRVIEEHSTAGEWCETSQLCSSAGVVPGWQ